ncbi:MAG: 16S rRNA (guanine(527)-N(7))-methyltransferase RsmG [Alicyclobacillus sp.]|nr:16S rRNA (guanine(527)-N(7))-methyltransferase RsmG [Alicyclobacillus sp.]
MDNGTDVDWSFLTVKQQGQLDAYYRMLVEWNDKMNLTAIVEREEVYVKHFWDSMAVRKLPAWQKCVSVAGKRVLDIGTGAGFPGLPLAVLYPEIEFVLVDALQKRLTFLRAVLDALSVTNVHLVHGRAEDLGKAAEYREQFDAVTSRAVARLNVLLELMAPFAAVGGALFAYKGPSVADELPEGERAARQLGVALTEPVSMQLPANMGDRTIVFGEKIRPTPARFPRKAGVPQKQPLN